jgi:hypothetical protein
MTNDESGRGMPIEEVFAKIEKEFVKRGKTPACASKSKR